MRGAYAPDTTTCVDVGSKVERRKQQMKSSPTMHQTLIALGANIADPAAALPLAWRIVVAELGLQRPRLSAVISSLPAEAATGPSFANAVGLGYTSAEPEDVLAQLHRIEAAFGRDREQEGHHGCRPLDLDLLAMGALRREGPTLTLPHPRIAHRDFVLAPLLELTPAWIEPRSGRPAALLLARLADDAPTKEMT